VSAKRGKASPFKRQPTRHRGVSYRERDGGGRTYFVTVGSRHLRVDGGEREALLVQADLRSKQGRGLRVTPVATTFGELAEEWFELGTARWRRSTQTGYRIALSTHLLPAFGHLPLGAITPDMIAGFVARRLGSSASHSYVAGNLRPLNGVFKLALRRGLVSANPMAALLPEERPKPKRRKRRTWTPDDIKRLVDAARELGSRVGQVHDYTPLIVLAIYTGMRVGELLGLRWQDVDLKDGVIRVRHQLCRETRTLIPPKTEAGTRDIPIPASLVGYLRRYRLGSAFSRGEHFLFCSQQGTPLDRGNVRKRGFHAAVELAGLNRPGEPTLTTYDLRHAFASVVSHHGFAGVDLAVFMGHSDSRVTEQVYIHPYNELATAAKLRNVVDAAITEHVTDSSERGPSGATPRLANPGGETP
jgi:integrase